VVFAAKRARALNGRPGRPGSSPIRKASRHPLGDRSRPRLVALIALMLNEPTSVDQGFTVGHGVPLARRRHGRVDVASCQVCHRLVLQAMRVCQHCRDESYRGSGEPTRQLIDVLKPNRGPPPPLTLDELDRARPTSPPAPPAPAKRRQRKKAKTSRKPPEPATQAQVVGATHARRVRKIPSSDEDSDPESLAHRIQRADEPTLSPPPQVTHIDLTADQGPKAQEEGDDDQASQPQEDDQAQDEPDIYEHRLNVGTEHRDKTLGQVIQEDPTFVTSYLAADQNLNSWH
jgi:hypothetical protein